MINLLLMFSFWWLTSSQSLQPLPATEAMRFKKEMQARLEGINTLSSEFKQIRHMDFMDNPIHSQGTFFYQQPHFVRWNYIAPSAHSLLLDGNHLHSYQKGNSKKTSLQAHRSMRELYTLLNQNNLSKQLFNEQKFTISYFKKGPKMVVRMVPKEKALAKMMQRIEIQIDTKTLLVDQLILLEDEGNYTEIMFNKQLINRPLDPNLFKSPIR